MMLSELRSFIEKLPPDKDFPLFLMVDGKKRDVEGFIQSTDYLRTNCRAAHASGNRIWIVAQNERWKVQHVLALDSVLVESEEGEDAS